MSRDNSATARPGDDKAIRHAAAEWLARRHGGLAPHEQHALESWLRLDPRHHAAFVEMDGAWSLINAPAAAGNSAALRHGLALEVQRRTRQRRRRLFVPVAFAAAAAIAVLAFLPRTNTSEPSDLLAATMTLRPDTRTLEDGSVVEFNARAEIAVEFTPELRAVRLIRGEAHFTITPDPARPFVVSAGGVAVKAVGTAFSVRFHPKQVDVLVTEGKVAVAQRPPAPTSDFVGNSVAPSPPAEPIYVSAGGRIALPVDAPVAGSVKIELLSPKQIAQVLNWRGKRIEFTDTPLSDAVALFNRQNDLRIVIANRGDGARCISGIFWSDDPAGFARILEASLGLTMAWEDNTVVLGAR